MNDLLQDLAFAWRNAMKKPGTALLIVLTLALGIGANTAMFSMTWHVVMAPLPYKDGGQLVRVVQHAPKADLDNTPWSVPTFMDYREQNTVFSDIVEYHRMTFTLLGHGDPHLVTTGVVSWQYFDFLGIKPLLGRGFVSTDEVIGAEASILLTYEFWQEKFGGDPDIVGTALEMNNAVHTVIGVLPKILPFPHDNDIWITTTSCPFRASDQFINGRQVPIINGVFGKHKARASHAKGF
ncbi:MAG: ABC transporter permease, partial [Pseudomonadota bacterium]